jgi:tetratricopeptide (TPR) repeat protein
MHKRFIYFFFISIILFSFTFNQKKDELKKIEYIINQNKEINDTIVLKKNIDQLRENASTDFSSNLDVIYSVCLAEIYSKQMDKLNPKSTQLLLNANKIANSLNNSALSIWVNTKTGFYYYTYSQYIKAFPYFMHASKLIDSSDSDEIIQQNEVYKTNAYFFGSVGEIQKSKNYLKLALQYTDKSDKEYGNILNALGSIYYNKNDLKNAKHYYDLSLNSALKNNDKFRYAKVLGDIALIYYGQKNFDKAISSLKEDIEISEKLKEYKNLMFAKIRLGKIYYELNNLSEAKNILTESKNYASSKEYLKSFERDINIALLDIAIKENNTVEELQLRREISEIDKHLVNSDGKEVLNKINWDIQKKNFEYKYQAQQNNIQKAKIQKNAWIVITVLLILICLSIYFLFKRKIRLQNTQYENKVLKLELEKEKSEHILSQTSNSLENYKIYLTEKNRQIEFLNKEIDSIYNSTKFNPEKEKGKLNQLLHSHLMTDENWNNFKMVFMFEQKDFCNYLKENYPQLTESNLRIIFLNKLGLNNTEISHILGITVDAVKKAKQRLKKKYENFDYIIDNDININ